MKAVRRKVVVYCVDGDRLLVIRHPDFPPEEVGLQVPAGTIGDGEDPRAAALRELREETGHDAFEIVAELGQARYDITPYRAEIQDRTFFHARPTAPTRLECLWIPLTAAHVLQAGQGALVARLYAEKFE